MDMREVPEGCTLDEFHFEMWTGFLRFMIGEPEVLVEFEAETGKRFLTERRGGIEVMIDKACGFDPAAENALVMAEFGRWATANYWGGPEDICPAIAKKLAAYPPPTAF